MDNLQVQEAKPKLKLTGLKTFLWNEVIDVPLNQGLFIFRLSQNPFKEENSNKDKDDESFVVNFELSFIWKKDFYVMVKNVISKSPFCMRFSPTTTDLLAQQVSDYIHSCFVFHNTNSRLVRPVLIFLADCFLVDNDVFDNVRGEDVVVTNPTSDIDRNYIDSGLFVDRNYIDYERGVEELWRAVDEMERRRREISDNQTRPWPHRLLDDDYRPITMSTLPDNALRTLSTFGEGSHYTTSILSSDLEHPNDFDKEELRFLLNILRSKYRISMTNMDKDVPKCLDKVKITIELTQTRQIDEDQQEQEQEQEERVCSICLDNMNSDDDDYNKEIVKMVRCSHLFHRACIFKWLPTKRSCPHCRSSTSCNVCF